MPHRSLPNLALPHLPLLARFGYVRSDHFHELQEVAVAPTELLPFALGILEDELRCERVLRDLLQRPIVGGAAGLLYRNVGTKRPWSVCWPDVDDPHGLDQAMGLHSTVRLTGDAVVPLEPVVKGMILRSCCVYDEPGIESSVLGSDGVEVTSEAHSTTSMLLVRSTL